MRLLFITRKYPPAVGGMEKVSFALAKEFSKKVDTTLITFGGSQKFLPFILPYFLIKALYLIPKNKIDHIHLGDALLAPLGFFLKTIFNIKTTVTVMGLDITYKFSLYQFIVPKFVARLDKIICISNATLEECVKRGVPKEKCIFIPCGVYPEEFKVKATRKDLEKIVGQRLDDKKVIITVGRLVERKGVYWFIKNVFPKLNNNVVYLVIGEGSEKQRIKELLKLYNFEKRIYLLGKVSDKDLKVIYNTADLFVMPNIKVKDNIEGFGVVVLEAASTGLPVITSRIDGIQDAVIDGKTGILIENTAFHFVKAINNSKKPNRILISNKIAENFSWVNLGKRYIQNIA